MDRLACAIHSESKESAQTGGDDRRGQLEEIMEIGAEDADNTGAMAKLLDAQEEITLKMVSVNDQLQRLLRADSAHKRRRKIYQEAAAEAHRRMEAKEKMAKIATQAATHAMARQDRREMGRQLALAVTEEIWRRKKKMRDCSEVATAAAMAVKERAYRRAVKEAAIQRQLYELVRMQWIGHQQQWIGHQQQLQQLIQQQQWQHERQERLEQQQWELQELRLQSLQSSIKTHERIKQMENSREGPQQGAKMNIAIGTPGEANRWPQVESSNL